MGTSASSPNILKYLLWKLMTEEYCETVWNDFMEELFLCNEIVVAGR